MDREKIARELVQIAKELISKDEVAEMFSQIDDDMRYLSINFEFASTVTRELEYLSSIIPDKRLANKASKLSNVAAALGGSGHRWMKKLAALKSGIKTLQSGL